ncbi:hypothetical protein E6C67_08095 [Azospirillum sp. TSA2s]|uniref:hypothetical protein n=1 Tax=Azospirillum sp. TSA2s TaxID=709810 RepID=UPI0010A9DBD3|nr:hypothetical protein [Azospirillum sp. TSA2s]QCG93901.1 hypothetical protein E6C67_08095 [Azospirillum sp. TSA2s]
MSADLLERARSAGRWKAYVTDGRPGKRRGEDIPRALSVYGDFQSEAEALTAAHDAIAAGWVSEYMIHRETAKASADFILPPGIINEIGRHLEAAQEEERADGN